MSLYIIGHNTFIPIFEARSKEWEGKGYRNPVVLQIYNLYGHPRAGFYWEQHVDRAARKEGWKPFPGWECLYYHPGNRLVMNVDVDDFKIAGDKANIDDAIKRLRIHMKLDEAVPINSGIYLGLTQRDIPVPPDLLKEKQDLYDLIMHAKHPTALPQKTDGDSAFHSVMRSKKRPDFDLPKPIPSPVTSRLTPDQIKAGA